ncbi:hypothetical protein DSO57_1011202 [Entomophthora muscae]|uniref:Uncharacterized protein n=1 Tax=Entomophthora muscae TaxID=34485 RepID=A0ACC2URD7_9FUNG|nr:hypothetical protein DSO57_1011202 [Entomophthora muscae]
MARWRDDNKVLSHKIASLETKLFKALSKEGNGNKIQGQDNDGMDWLDLDLPQTHASKAQQKEIHYHCYQLCHLLASSTSRKKIISKFGKPELLITDGGKELTSEDTNVYLTKMGFSTQ